MTKSLVICKNCNTPYIDDIIDEDNLTTCPKCSVSTNISSYNKNHICDIELLFWGEKS